MNEKERSEEYYAQLAEHQAQGDANEANAEGTIFPQGEPIEATGRYSEIGRAEDREDLLDRSVKEVNP